MDTNGPAAPVVERSSSNPVSLPYDPATQVDRLVETAVARCWAAAVRAERAARPQRERVFLSQLLTRRSPKARRACRSATMEPPSRVTPTGSENDARFIVKRTGVPALLSPRVGSGGKDAVMRRAKPENGDEPSQPTAEGWRTARIQRP